MRTATTNTKTGTMGVTTGVTVGTGMIGRVQVLPITSFDGSNERLAARCALPVRRTDDETAATKQ